MIQQTHKGCTVSPRADSRVSKGDYSDCVS